MVPQTPIGKEDEQGDSIPFDPEWYRSAIGSLMYLCTCTRPDLSFAVNALAKFMSTPCEHHAVAVKRVMRYLAGTLALGLTFSGNHDDITSLKDSATQTTPRTRTLASPPQASASS
jgi:hypothetical protein